MLDCVANRDEYVLVAIYVIMIWLFDAKSILENEAQSEAQFFVQILASMWSVSNFPKRIPEGLHLAILSGMVP
jgi:hypothetical protein